MEARIVTLEELKRNYDELGLINEKQEKRVRYIETETTKIVISYVFLQALIYISNNTILIASNANHIRAHDCERSLWAPFSLSLPIAALFGIAFAAKAHEWRRTAYEFDVNLAGRESILYKMSSLREKRDNDRLINVDGMNSEALLVCKPDVVKVYKRNAFVLAATLALLGYTVVILTACAQSRTLCGHGEA